MSQPTFLDEKLTGMSVWDNVSQGNEKEATMIPALASPLKVSGRERRAARRDRRVLGGTMKYRGQFMSVEILNLSSGGAYLVAPTVPDRADTVTIVLDLPLSDGPVMVAGRVCGMTLSSRTLDRPAGFGVRFTRFFTTLGQDCLQKHLAC
jgi:Tfp pilus assembly protein PilZ